MRKTFLLFVLFVSIFTAASVFAENEDSEITLYIGGMLGSDLSFAPPPLYQNVNAVFDDKITGGFRLAYYFTPRIAGEAGFGLSPSTVLGTAYVNGGTQTSTLIGVDTYILHANVVANLLQGPVIPYVTGGVGGIHFDVQRSYYNYGAPTPSETDFAWNAGGGVKIPVRDTAAIRLDGRVYWVNPEFSSDVTHFTEVTGGISVMFNF